MKIRNHTPATGPAIRLCSCVAGSRPNSGLSGRSPPSVIPEAGSATPNSITIIAVSVPRLPVAIPSPESPPTRAGVAIEASIALWNTSVNWKQVARITTRSRMTLTGRPPCAPGIANQSAMQLTDMMSATAASHGFLGPVRSETAPISGARSATQMPTIVFARLQASCPRTASPITTLAK